jgi:hypothetical protein
VSDAINGVFTLAPNTVNWAVGDSVEEPHYHQQNTSADTEIVTQYVPRPVQYVSAGKSYTGNVTAGLRGWEVLNDNPANYYLGGGGTHNPPDDAHWVSGEWRNDFEVDAGSHSLIYAHCNAVAGCSRWDSTYDLFLLDSAVGSDFEQYEPQSSTVTWNLQGNPYSFSPTAFTARTINVGTLNATTISGGVSGSAITSGTINAARLPVFGPSGTSHAAGIVPDPGATAGATRYLREDGTWVVPAGGGGGGAPTGAAGGDLAGSYPNPTVAAVHATAGTLDGVTVGGTTQASGFFTTVGIGTNSPVNQLDIPSSSTTNSLARLGSLEFSSYSLNNAWVGDNVFYNGTCFTRRQTGFSGLFYFQGGPSSSGTEEGQFRMSGYGSGCAGSGTNLAQLKISNTGEFGVGANLSNLNGNFTGATFHVDPSGNGTFAGSVAAPSYLGPATAPSGSCTVNGAWAFSQDGHATFCASGTWVTKI